MPKKKIFISYAREDLSFAEKLFDELSAIPEFLPWLDKKTYCLAQSGKMKFSMQLEQATLLLFYYLRIPLPKKALFKEN